MRPGQWAGLATLVLFCWWMHRVSTRGRAPEQATRPLIEGRVPFMNETQAPRSRLAIALAIIYLVWGSSFLATKILVTDEPPLVAAGLRFSAAGCLLTAFAWWRYGPPVLTRIELWHVLAMSFLSVLFSNACHVIAMQFVQSNTAALLNATPALWIAWLGTFGHAPQAALRRGAGSGCSSGSRASC